MKARFLMAFAAFAVASTGVFAATGGSDNTQGSQYGDGWQNADDRAGDGFTQWNITTFGSGGFFLGDSAAQGFGNINSGGTAFGLFGNPGGGGYDGVDAIRDFEGGALVNGDAFTIDLAIAFRNGNKGINLRDGGGSEVWNFNVGSDTYSVSGVGNLGWSYSQQSIFNLRVEQGAGQYRVLLSRGGDSHDSGLIAGSIGGFKLYIGETDQGDLNNLFANNMAVIIPEPSTIVLGIVGALGLVVARRRMK